MARKRVSTKKISAVIAAEKYKSGNPVVNAKRAGASYSLARRWEAARLVGAFKRSFRKRSNVSLLGVRRSAKANVDTVYKKKVVIRKMNGQVLSGRRKR